ncbi:MAG: ATP synthase F1 subunit gamma [Alphaproteobacteria bacterium]|nr:ATP synthase F1 subunit gamma [Alphaproteobacteria bacterium]
MSSLKKISDRIKTISSTHQVTASMKVVAVSRLKKLHENFLQTGAYTLEIRRMIRRLIRSISYRQEALTEQGSSEILPIPALLKGNGKDDHYAVVVITSDDGLSGSSNMQVVQKTEEVIKYLEEQGKKITLVCFGTRGGDILRRQYPNMRIQVVKRKMHTSAGPYLDAERMAMTLISAFGKDQFDVCLFVYNEFKSVVSQKPTIEQVIPNKLFSEKNPWQFLIDTNDADYITRDAMGQKKINLHKSEFLTAFGGVGMLSPLGAIDRDEILLPPTRTPDKYDYDPSDLQILENVLPQYMVSYMCRVLLETEVADNAARLMAMDNATRNAGEMLKGLQKQYRRTRQSKITTDLIEIVSGAMSEQS